ncbi:MAG: hypothetical protein ACK5RL_10730 [Acidimicrobiales bacterium]
MSKQDPATGPGDLRSRLRVQLRAAIRARHRVAADSIRVALAAIENAEAQPIETGSPAGRHPAGPAAADVPRREIGEAGARVVVMAEIEELRQAAAGFDRLGQHEAARRVASQATVLEEILADRSAGT